MENFQQLLSDTLQIPLSSVELCSERIKVRQVNKNEFLLREGEICKDTFFVNKGLLRMYSIDNHGKEHIIHFAPENWFLVDRTSFYLNEPTQYFIDSIENSEVLILSPDYFEYILEKHPEVANRQNKLLHNHIRNLQKRITQLLGATSEERYLDFLKTYPNIFERVPQWMVASYLGITPESLSRVRKELTKRK